MRTIKTTQKSFNSLVHDLVKTTYSLSRRDNSVFYRPLGFLLRNDKSFAYSNDKLALITLYKISSIKEALNNLEKLGLIVREGFGYRRRFYKGKTLVNICTHSQYCIDMLQYENCTTGQSLAITSQKPATIKQEENELKHCVRENPHSFFSNQKILETHLKKFPNNEIPIEKLWNECEIYYKNKKRVVTEIMFINWINREEFKLGHKVDDQTIKSRNINREFTEKERLEMSDLAWQERTPGMPPIYSGEELKRIQANRDFAVNLNNSNIMHDIKINNSPVIIRSLLESLKYNAIQASN